MLRRESEQLTTAAAFADTAVKETDELNKYLTTLENVALLREKKTW